MIKYICPGYIALATWTGIEYSDPVTVDLWCEWGVDPGGTPYALLLASKHAPVGKPWEAEFRVKKSGPADHLLHITFFSEAGLIMFRYTGSGTTFMPDAGLKVNAWLGGR